MAVLYMVSAIFYLPSWLVFITNFVRDSLTWSSQSGRLPTPPSESNSTPQQGSTTAKPRLSKEQQQQNHAGSETRRRQKLEDGWSQVADLIPGVDRKEAKKIGLVSKKAIQFTSEQLAKRKRLMEVLEAKGVNVEQDLGIKRDERAPIEMPLGLTKAKNMNPDKAGTE
ncbi:MAG: hypothetical protein LQ352_001365 [Teloschistes flavicans]|nr:MAG: hypothetical protein LQ352_001365 [Teloschistes flavicans]